ncbi:MAG: hypothetical protein WCJ93_04845 [Methanomicrobiales archaeon]
MTEPGHTRPHEVDFIARNLLLRQGYFVVRSAGSQTPVDLVAWSPDHVLLVKTRRWRSKIESARTVTIHFGGVIRLLQRTPAPPGTKVQLWIYVDHEGWHMYDVLPGGIMGAGCHA